MTLCSKCQIDGEDFINFFGVLRKHELYPMTTKLKIIMTKICITLLQTFYQMLASAWICVNFKPIFRLPRSMLWILEFSFSRSNEPKASLRRFWNGPSSFKLNQPDFCVTRFRDFKEIVPKVISIFLKKFLGQSKQCM